MTTGVLYTGYQRLNWDHTWEGLSTTGISNGRQCQQQSLLIGAEHSLLRLHQLGESSPQPGSQPGTVHGLVSAQPEQLGLANREAGSVPLPSGSRRSRDGEGQHAHSKGSAGWQGNGPEAHTSPGPEMLRTWWWLESGIELLPRGQM